MDENVQAVFVHGETEDKVWVAGNVDWAKEGVRNSLLSLCNLQTETETENKIETETETEIETEIETENKIETEIETETETEIEAETETETKVEADCYSWNNFK